MKTNHKLALAVLAGASIGVAGARTIHAQQVKAPPAYVIAEVDVTDPATMQKYGEKVPETLAPFEHHYVVRGGKTQSLEGEPPKRIVVTAFDSAEKIRPSHTGIPAKIMSTNSSFAASTKSSRLQFLKSLISGYE